MRQHKAAKLTSSLENQGHFVLEELRRKSNCIGHAFPQDRVAQGGLKQTALSLYKKRRKFGTGVSSEGRRKGKG